LSLYSSFYIGDPEQIGRHLKAGDLKALHNDPGISVADFSGGIAQPFLFPQDLGRLLSPLAASPDDAEAAFWSLTEKQILGTGNKEDEHGAHVLSASGVQRLCQVDGAAVSAFSSLWNKERHRRHNSAQVARSVWRSRSLWAIVAGVSGGLLAGAVQPPHILSLLLLIVFLALTFAFAWLLERRRRSRLASSPIIRSDIDWVPAIKSLQQKLSSSLSSGQRVIYYWSL